MAYGNIGFSQAMSMPPGVCVVPPTTTGTPWVASMQVGFDGPVPANIMLIQPLSLSQLSFCASETTNNAKKNTNIHSDYKKPIYGYATWQHLIGQTYIRGTVRHPQMRSPSTSRTADRTCEGSISSVSSTTTDGPAPLRFSKAFSWRSKSCWW